jgi:hypothetical protein
MNVIAKPSLKSLYLQMRFNGQNLSCGTGFVVFAKSGAAVLITARHNFTGRHQDSDKLLSRYAAIPNEVVIHHNKKGKPGEWTHRVEKVRVDDIPCWVEHPVLGSNADVVALKLQSLEDVDLHVYDSQNVGHDILVCPADPVSVVGFPFGLKTDGFPIWATGFIASEPTVDLEGMPIQLIDCRSRKGQSGSPVVAYHGSGSIPIAVGTFSIMTEPAERFIGVYSGRINGESDLGIVWKASAINELIQTL